MRDVCDLIVRFYIAFEVQILVQYNETVERVKYHKVLQTLGLVDFKLKELPALVYICRHVEKLLKIYLIVRLFYHRGINLGFLSCLRCVFFLIELFRSWVFWDVFILVEQLLILLTVRVIDQVHQDFIALLIDKHFVLFLRVLNFFPVFDTDELEFKHVD